MSAAQDELSGGGPCKGTAQCSKVVPLQISSKIDTVGGNEWIGEAKNKKGY